MNTEQLKTGDTVQLKSGGPVMTLGRPYKSLYTCYWFNNNELLQDTLPIQALIKVNPKTDVPLPIKS